MRWLTIILALGAAPLAFAAMGQTYVADSGLSALKTADDIVIAKLDLTKGTLPLPAGPWLGATHDEDKLARYGFFCHRGGKS